MSGPEPSRPAAGRLDGDDRAGARRPVPTPGDSRLARRERTDEGQELHPRCGSPAARRTSTRSTPSPTPPPTSAASSRRSRRPSPGLRISEAFPKLAKVLEQGHLVVRGVTSPEIGPRPRGAPHAHRLPSVGRRRSTPGMGSVISKVRGGESSRTALPALRGDPRRPDFYASSGYLTPAYDPFSVRDQRPEFRRTSASAISRPPTDSRSTASSAVGRWSRRSTTSRTTCRRPRSRPAATSSPSGPTT